MKRLIFSAAFLFLISFSYGATANKMSMVTYFPVPYVAYSQVEVGQQLDVGLTSTCNMNLGCNESSVNLQANTVNLKRGKLELNNGTGVLGQSLSLGNGNGTGQIRFKDVRIQGGNMQSLNAGSMHVRSLELFGKPFPPCQGKGGSTGQMKWQKLPLQGYSGTDPKGELYLVCGDLGETEEEPEPDQPTKRKCLTAAKFCQIEDIEGSFVGGNDNAENSCSGKCFDAQTEMRSFPFDVLPEYTQVPAGCQVNGECPSCKVGKKYVPPSYHENTPQGMINSSYHFSCQEGFSMHTKYLIQYAVCEEVYGECPVEPNRDCAHDDLYMCVGNGTDMPSGPEFGRKVED